MLACSLMEDLYQPIIFLVFTWSSLYSPTSPSWPEGLLIEHLQTWSPLILLGLIAVFRKNVSKGQRVAVLIVPLIFMFLAYVSVVRRPSSVPLYSNLFPKYLETHEYAGVALDLSDPTIYDDQDFFEVSFDVNEPYPCHETLAFLSNQFESTGFSKLSHELESPNTPSVWFVPSGVSNEKPSPTDLATWEGDWIHETNNIILKVSIYRYMQKTDVNIDASRTVGWSRRAIKLRHQIQFYNKIINKIEK